MLARGLRTLEAPGSAASMTYDRVILDFEWPISIFVLALAILYPNRLVKSRRSRRALTIALSAWVLLWLAVIFRKEFFYPPGGPDPSALAPWLTFLLDDVRYYLATAVALYLFGRAHWQRSAGATDGTAAFLLLAFALGPLLTTFPFLRGRPGYVLRHLQDLPPVTLAGLTMSFLGALLLATVFVWAVWRSARARQPTRLLAIGGACAFGFGVAQDLVYRYVVPELAGAFGFYGEAGYLVARPILLGYAILRFQLFDADVRLKRAFATTLMMLLIGAVFLPVEEAVRRFSGLPPDMALPAGIAAGLGVALAVQARVQQFARGASDSVFHAVREEDSRYFEEKKREIYSAALERALDDRLAITPHGAEELARLRRRLDIRDTEHEALLARVQEAARTQGGSGDGDTPAPDGSILMGRYRVESLLGEGGSGRTYRCHDTRLDRTVAVKEIVGLDAADPRTRRRALREARLLASVHHPRVVGIHDVFDIGRRTLLVMEHVDGGSLADRLARDGPFTPEEARLRVRDVLQGLTALHAAGLTHRDVKPSNVLLNAEGAVKLADFGLARNETSLTVTSLGRPAGTPAYMAPEQVLGADVDARTDVYAVGALLYELLTGEPYVRAAMRKGKLVEEAIVSAPPPLPIEGAPEWANAFLQQALAKDPTNRFPTAEAALDALKG